jgi:membrane fusion protein (multidrug efflux system)
MSMPICRPCRRRIAKMNPNETAESPDNQWTASPETPPEAASVATPRFRRRRAAALALAPLFVVAAVAIAAWIIHARTHESTDDAATEGQIIAVAPKIAGRVASVHVADNQPVRAGDLLFEIDPGDCEVLAAQKKAALEVARTKQASAKAHVKTTDSIVASAQAAVDGAQADARRDEQDLQRRRALSKGGVISTEELDHSSADATSKTAALVAKVRQAEAAVAYLGEAQAQEDSAGAEMHAAEAELRQAELQLSYTKVTAPDEGFVTRKSIEPGDYLQAGQTTLALVSREVWVTANFKETQLTEMRPGQRVRIKIDAYPDHAFTGHVDSIQAGSGARFSLFPPENASGNFVKVVQRVPVKIVFDEKPPAGESLGPGMSVYPTVTVGNVRFEPLILVLVGIAAIVVALAGLAVLWRKTAA